MVNMAIAYLITELPYGVPFTLDSAYPFLADRQVMFGFPDIILQPDDIYRRLQDRMCTGNADLVLGLFRAVNPQKADMVVLGDDGAIAGIDIKPARTRLQWTWSAAVWNAAFTGYMHDYVVRERRHIAASASGGGRKTFRERFVGDVIREAIGSGLKIDYVKFHQNSYIDIGSPDDLKAAVRTHANEI